MGQIQLRVMLPASPGETHPKQQIFSVQEHSLPVITREEDESLIYELTPNRHRAAEEGAEDSSSFGEVLQVKEMFVKDEQFNRELIKNYHQHIEEDHRIRVFIDPNPVRNHSPPPPHKEPPPVRRPPHVQKDEPKRPQSDKQEAYETVKEHQRPRAPKERRSTSKDLRIRQLSKGKGKKHNQQPKTARKKSKASQSPSEPSSESQEGERDSYEEYKEFKRRKEARGVKGLIKKVDYLQKQVEVLRGEKQELEKLKIIAKDSGRKQYGLASNLISVKVDSDHIKQDILSELHRLKQKVDNLSEGRRGQSDRYGSMSPVNLAESKMEHTNLILSQARDRSKTGKIFKKSDVRPSNEQEHPLPQSPFISNEMLDRQDRIENISEINQAKPRSAIAVSKEKLQQREKEEEGHRHQQPREMVQDKKAVSHIQDISKSSTAPPGLQRANSEHHPSPVEPQEPKKNLQENRERRKQLEHKEHSPPPPPPPKQHEPRGFIRSGMKINSFPVDAPQRREEEDTLKMLEFDTGKEKFIVDSRNTEQDAKLPRRAGDKGVNSFQEACALVPVMPQIQRLPTYDTSEEQLVQLGKELFNLLGVGSINDDQTVLKVKKYKNCTYFGIDSDNNILLHYQGRAYFGSWREFMNGEGEKAGEGVEWHPNKFLYKGQFRDGKRSGAGVLKVYNSAGKASVYMGQFVEGLKHGEGKQFDQNGVSYSGDWKEGKKDGFGRLVLGDREHYEGTFEKGLKHGHGVQTFKNGDKYQGSYAGGKFQGRGRYCWTNGSVYEGEFRNGMRNGKGVWRSSGTEGDIYEGEYEDDLKHGFGVYQWANGSSYEGHFHRDQKHGKGVLTHENGKVSRLEWENGNVVGKAEQSHPSSILTSATIRNHSRSLPVNKHIYAQKQSDRHKPIPPIISSDMLHHLKSSSASSLPRGVPATATRHQQSHDERNKNGPSPRPEAFMKLYEMSERPMTSKSISSASATNFKLERKGGVGGQGVGGLPRDPPYKGIRPTTNMINF